MKAKDIQIFPGPVSVLIKKELTTLFHTPVAYLVLIITLLIFNLFFFMIIDHNREASLRDIFQVMEFLFVFIIPILTMKTFAEERSTGTLELLLTCPVKIRELVTGKFLGTSGFLMILLLLTGIYGIILSVFAKPDIASMLSGYAGIVLVGLFFVSIGVMVSAWTSHHISAAIVTYALLFLLYFSHQMNKYVGGSLEIFLTELSAPHHSLPLYKGMITGGDVTYFVSGILAALILTGYALKVRR